MQHRDIPTRAHTSVPGKLDELHDAVRASSATCAVCEDDLTPAQVAAVLDAVDVDVLDRTELILSVFARHAHSLEGTPAGAPGPAQYELTRMRGQGQVLSRLGAGADMRGPGEHKLEVDRRVVRQRIQTLRGRIEHMAQTRRTQRARRVRADLPLIALAGYTNAGKSTLLNALTDAGVLGARPPLRDARPDHARRIATATATTWSPTPSASSASCRTSWSTPSPRRSRRRALADLLLVVADANQPADEIRDRQATVADVLAEIGSTDVPRLTVMNKVDLIDAPLLARLRAREPDAVFLSATSGRGSTTCSNASTPSSSARWCPCDCSCRTTAAP